MDKHDWIFNPLFNVSDLITGSGQMIGDRHIAGSPTSRACQRNRNGCSFSKARKRRRRSSQSGIRRASVV